MPITEKDLDNILLRSKEFFREHIAANHLKNMEKLSSLKEFKINPFTHQYLAQFAFGDSSPESLAKALIYPRVLGTSIATTFGAQIQRYCNDVLYSFASVTSGMDIEFTDALDNRHKYCQIKAGPLTINKDDEKTIKDHFKAVIRLARTNHLEVQFNDCVLGVLYGTPNSINQFYKNIGEEYPVYVGQEFWYHLTGDPNFYYRLIDAFSSVATEMDSSKNLEFVIKKLADDIRRHQN